MSTEDSSLVLVVSDESSACCDSVFLSFFLMEKYNVTNAYWFGLLITWSFYLLIDCFLPLHQLLCAFFCKSTDSLLALAYLECFFTSLVSVLNLFFLHSVLGFKANGLAQTSASETLF